MTLVNVFGNDFFGVASWNDCSHCARIVIKLRFESTEWNGGYQRLEERPHQQHIKMTCHVRGDYS